MPLIQSVRCVLLTSPYADADDPEIKECFPNGAKRTIAALQQAGISLSAVTDKLLADGLTLFQDADDQLMATLEQVQ